MHTQERALDGAYTSLDELQADVFRMFSNATLYQPDSDQVKDDARILKVILRKGVG